MSCSKNGRLLMPFISDVILGVVRPCHGQSIAYTRVICLIYVYMHMMKALFQPSSHVAFAET